MRSAGVLDAPGRRARAIEEVEAWVATLPGSHRPLADTELRSYEHTFVLGWQIDVGFEDRTRKLDLLIDTGFPRTPARLALVDRSPFLSWPHVEKDGLLCLLPELGGVSARSPVAVVRHLFALAIELVEECVSGSNEQDLRDEFRTYWYHAADAGAPDVISLLRPGGPSREMCVWRGTRLTIVGEDAHAVETWLQNIESSGRRFSAEPGIFLWLPRPLLPVEYPSSAQDVLLLARRTAPALARRLEGLAGVEEPIQVILGAETTNGACFGAVRVQAPRRANPHERASGRALSRGFRQGRVPPDILARRRFGALRAIRSTVARADAAWVHGRGRDPRFETLREGHVIMLGCGSVGAPTAVALIEAGVGSLTLIDPEPLTFANVGRHPLGAEDVPRNKAVALAERLRRRFPHARQVTGYARRWEDLVRDKPDLLASADLIVSAIGDWASEGALNEWSVVVGRDPPVLYAWTEAHACAGHAVLVGSRGGCLQCGVTDLGVPRDEVTTWGGTTTRAEPGCGARFQPYGPVELGHTISLVAELALDSLLGIASDSVHRIWAAPQEFLASCGGTWSPAWRASAESGKGGLVLQRQWKPDPACPECGQGDTA
jgi:molybdopterin/thiamine biosynthesis adenylyltransferase